MQIQKAERKKVKIKLGLQGPSGSGKTYSALLLAYGLTGDWNKITVIDTENHSASLYAHLGDYNVLHLSAPYTPESYIEAIRYCITEGMEVILLDSISHEWEGSGGILDTHSKMTGNSFTAWAKLTPRHNAFVQEVLQSPAHILATIRSKQDYVLVDKNGKMIPEKVGLKGKIILEWCNNGKNITVDEISQRIGECKSIQELFSLYKMFPQFKEALQKEYETQKRRILINQDVQTQLSNQNTSNNGTE